MPENTLQNLIDELSGERRRDLVNELSKPTDANDGRDERNQVMENFNDCEHCGREKQEHTIHKDACDDCMEDLAICCDCNNLVSDSEVYFNSDNAYCEDCYREIFYLCAGCENDFHNDDMHLAFDEYYCDDCFYNAFFTCSHCEEVGSLDNAYATDYSDYLCSDCYWEMYTECEECGETIDREYSMFCEDTGCTLCEGCYSENSSMIIRDYSYRPDPKFHGKDEFHIGVELEFEVMRNRSDIAEMLNDFDPDHKVFYQKHDGSLNNGIELVTHPCTLEYHNKSFKWSEMLKKLRESNCKSHDTGTCGMHLHISRKSLTKSQEIKLAMFVKANQRRMEMFCRRKSNHYARFKESLKPYFQLNDGYERYEVLNFSNYNTIEFRLPKGTLNTKAVKATIQFTHAMVAYARHQSASKLASSNKGWTEFVLYVGENTKQYPDLMEYMQTRGVA